MKMDCEPVNAVLRYSCEKKFATFKINPYKAVQTIKNRREKKQRPV